MHQKVFLVDDDLAAVGTTNLNNRSFRLKFENMALIFDQHAAREVKRMFEKDFQRAVLMTKLLADQPHKVRIGAPFARLFSPLL